MKGYSENMLFSDGAKSCLQMANIIVNKIDHEWKERDELRCHEVVRICYEIIAEKYPLIKVVDGVFGDVDHSWLVIERSYILDVYCIGRLPQVQLAHPYIPSSVDLNDLYQEREERKDIKIELVNHIINHVTEKMNAKHIRERNPSRKMTMVWEIDNYFADKYSNISLNDFLEHYKMDRLSSTVYKSIEELQEMLNYLNLV